MKCPLYIEAIFLGLVVAFFIKGRISNLASMEYRATWILMVALLLQIAPIPLTLLDVGTEMLYLLPFASTVLALLFIFLNRWIRGSVLFLLGGGLNILAMALNDFRMPLLRQATQFLSLDHLIEGIQSGVIINYRLDEGLTLLQIALGKWLPVPSFYGFPKVISPGDVLITLALFWFVVRTSKDSLYRRSAVLRYGYKPK